MSPKSYLPIKQTPKMVVNSDFTTCANYPTAGASSVNIDADIVDDLTHQLPWQLDFDHENSSSTSSSIHTPSTTPPHQPSLLRPFHPIPSGPSHLSRQSRATVWQVPFDSIEWETELGRRATAFITIPADSSICYHLGVVHHGFLSSLCHEMVLRCCEIGSLVAMNLDYHGSILPGETVVLTVRTVCIDAHEQRLSCQINRSVNIVVSGEAILSIPSDRGGLSEDRNRSEKRGDVVPGR